MNKVQTIHDVLQIVVFLMNAENEGKFIRFITNKKYVLWNMYLSNALHSVCINRLSCTGVGIYNGANSPDGFLTPAIA